MATTVEAASPRLDSFVLDGEAVLLGVDSMPELNGLHSRNQHDELQLYAPRVEGASRK
jgi:bifunctional non-homologous end joining protein LigD